MAKQASLAGDKYVNGTELARRLGIGRSTLKRWGRAGKLPKPQKKISGMLLFDEAMCRLTQQLNVQDRGDRPVELPPDGQTADIRVPLEFKVRGGRRESILPTDAATAAEVGPRPPLVAALARAYRWQRMIDSGEAPGVEAIAAKQGVGHGYVSRILGLAMLVPDLTVAALKGDEPGSFSLRKLATSLPVRWDQQGAILRG